MEKKKTRVVNIKRIGYEPVFNMEVISHHNFSINGGLIVHNCMDRDRYMIYTRFGNETPPINEKTKEMLKGASLHGQE